MRRTTALVLGLLALSSIVGQFWVNGLDPAMGGPLTRAWAMARYFTILTNALVALVLLREAAGRGMGANWQATALVSILMVGLIYQTLLAPPEPIAGPGWYTDFGLHAAVPVLTALWWLVWGDRPLRLAALPLWLAWPLAYCIYALVRGGIEGRYPYFFLDLGQFGPLRIAANIAGLVLVFALAGVVVWAAARATARQSDRPS